MSDEWLSANINSIAWAAVYGLTAVGLAAGAFHTGFGSTPDVSRTSRFWATCLLVCGTLPALDLGEMFAHDFPGGGKLLVQAAFLLTGLAVAKSLLSWPERSLRAGIWSSRLRCAITLIALASPTMLWASHRLYAKPDAEEDEIMLGLDFPMPDAKDLQEFTAVDLRTDRGTKIAAYRLIEEVANGDSLRRWLQENAHNCAREAILVSPPETQANCHGWVFASGQFFILGSEVDCILAENGYGPVAEPEPGDLIVYRDAEGGVMHTGLVKAVGSDGFTLIESKWGLYGRYLHESREQSYSPIFAFYRSPRSGHRLKNAWTPSRSPLSARWRCTGQLA